MSITQQQSPRRRRRVSRASRIPVTVGEDITAPLSIASGGRIRITSDRAATVARWFGLRRATGDDAATTAPPIETLVPIPAPGRILLITGPSGAGKSTLLRQLRQRVGLTPRTWIDLNEVESETMEDLPLVDCFAGAVELRDVLLLMSRVGLGEVWSYVRPPTQLSEGQRWRFRLALALHRASAVNSVVSPLIACDEFAAVLDRLTALVVARCLRHAVDADPRLGAVVATSHEDLQPALKPNAIAWCDFGKVEYRGLTT